jgi:Rad3-related DNA helicase
MNPTPREFGLRHSEFRPYQLETIQWALGIRGPGILQAATGFGKTTLPAALASKGRTVALVRTRALQSANYRDSYGFKALFGRANYTCAHDDFEPGTATAADCLHPGQMDACAFAGDCAYRKARIAARASSKTALNYAYWFHARDQWPAFRYLVLDEAHQLSDLTLEWAGLTVTRDNLIEFGLPALPAVASSRGASLLLTQPNPVAKVLDWIHKATAVLTRRASQLERPTTNKERRDLRATERMLGKVSATGEAMTAVDDPDVWFIRSQAPAGGLVCRPLTARYHFKNYFLRPDEIQILMSATIGDPATFAAELGLNPYDYKHIPSQYPVERRPVYALDVPRMGQSAKPADWDKQADEIAQVLKDCPADWHGIIHVNAKAEARRLHDRLARHRYLAGRLWVPSNEGGTDGQVRDWRAHRERSRNGQIAITWALHEGYDGVDEKICISAKVPYPYLGDDYEIARRNFDGKLFLQRAAWSMEQMLGRTRRSEADYDADGDQRGLVAIADGSWKWVRKYLTPDFAEAIRTV